MPVANAQAPLPAAPVARTRTRYSVPLSRPVTDSEAAGGSASVPRSNATQPSAAEGEAPVCTAAPSATAPLPVAEADV